MNELGCKNWNIHIQIAKPTEGKDSLFESYKGKASAKELDAKTVMNFKEKAALCLVFAGSKVKSNNLLLDFTRFFFTLSKNFTFQNWVK